MRDTRQKNMNVEAAAAVSETAVHLLPSDGCGLSASFHSGRGVAELRESRGDAGHEALSINHAAHSSESEGDPEMGSSSRVRLRQTSADVTVGQLASARETEAHAVFNAPRRHSSSSSSSSSIHANHLCFS